MPDNTLPAILNPLAEWIRTQAKTEKQRLDEIQKELSEIRKKNPGRDEIWLKENNTDDYDRLSEECKNLSAEYATRKEDWKKIKQVHKDCQKFQYRYPSKLELSKKMSQSMLDYFWDGPKEGGSKSPGKEGGCYLFVYKAPALDENGKIIYEVDVPEKLDKNRNIIYADSFVKDDGIAYRPNADGTPSETPENSERDPAGNAILDPHRVRLGCIPKIVTHTQKLLIKQDTDKKKRILHEKNIAEFVAGRINNKLIGDAASTIVLMSSNGMKTDDEENYIGSVYFDKYTDIVKTMKTGEKDAEGNDVTFKDRVPFHEKLNKEAFRESIADIDKYKNFLAGLASALRTGDRDVHSGNLGIAGWEGQEKVIKKIDHGAALHKLEDEVHLHSHMRYLPGNGPTNHFREYPRELKINAAFADELERQAEINLDGEIDEVMKEVSDFYSAGPIIDFAKRMGMNVSKYDRNKDTTKAEIIRDAANYLKRKMYLRGQSEKKLAMDIRMSVCFDKENKLDEHELLNTIYAKPENAHYFLKGDFHFRSKQQRINIGPIKIRFPIEPKLKKEVYRVLTNELPNIMVRAFKKNDLEAFKCLFANQKLMSFLPKDQLERYKNNYDNLKRRFDSYDFCYEYSELKYDSPEIAHLSKETKDEIREILRRAKENAWRNHPEDHAKFQKAPADEENARKKAMQSFASDPVWVEAANDIRAVIKRPQPLNAEKAKNVNFMAGKVEHVKDVRASELRDKRLEVIELLHNLAKKHPTYEKILLAKAKEVANLHLLSIPGEPDLYCQAGETTGVTEKISLVKLENVMTTLKDLTTDLRGDPAATLKNLIADHTKKDNNYTFATDAMIKLAKHGKIRAVLEEGLALKISQILGFTTTKFTPLIYSDDKFPPQPVLFIPFDPIKLFTGITHGETTHPFPTGESYEDNSTITPVGEGLMLDQFAPDFGELLAYFYLLSDPDVWGRDRQNIGLVKSENGLYDKFYNFDKTVQVRPKFAFNSNLTLKGIAITNRYPITSRHDVGRNKTVAEDTDFAAKFRGLKHLGMQKDEIKAMLDETIKGYNTELTNMKHRSKSLTSEEKIHFKNLKVLREHADKIRKVVIDRLNHALDCLPPINGRRVTDAQSTTTDNFAIIRQSLILEKIVNGPVLFTNDGRPYKHPYTKDHTNVIKNIEPKSINGTEYIEITFNEPIKQRYIEALKDKHIFIQNKKTHPELSSTKIRISKDHLHNLNDAILFPEQSIFDPKIDYLKTEDLKLIAEAYPADYRDHTLGVIDNYQNKIKNLLSNSEQALPVLRETLDKFDHLASRVDKNDLGLIRHVQKRLLFDVQTKLIEIFKDGPYRELAGQIPAAFNAAVKLDRANAFTTSLISALNRFLTNPSLEDFDKIYEYLVGCGNINNHLETNPLELDYFKAKEFSEAFYAQTLAFKQELEKPNALNIKPAPREEVDVESDDDLDISYSDPEGDDEDDIDNEFREENDDEDYDDENEEEISITITMLGANQHANGDADQLIQLHNQVVTDDHSYKWIISGPGAKPPAGFEAHPVLGAYELTDVIANGQGGFHKYKKKGVTAPLIKTGFANAGNKEVIQEINTIIAAVTEAHRVVTSPYQTAATPNRRTRIKVNLIGADNCVLAANALATKYPYNDNDVINHADPALPIVRCTLFATNVAPDAAIPKNVDRAVLTYPANETHIENKDLETNVKIRRYAGPSAAPLSLPADPSLKAAKGSNPDVLAAAVLFNHDLNKFCSESNIRLEDYSADPSKPLTPGEGVNLRYVVKVGNDKAYDVPSPKLTDDGVLYLYTHMRSNEKAYESLANAQGSAKPNVGKNDPDFIFHGVNYFYDQEHMRLFKLQYPKFFDYYFQQAKGGATKEELIAEIVEKMLGNKTLINSLKGIVDLTPALTNPYAVVNIIGDPKGIQTTTTDIYNPELMHLWRQAQWLCRPVLVGTDTSISQDSAQKFLYDFHAILISQANVSEKKKKMYGKFHKAANEYKGSGTFSIRLENILESVEAYAYGKIRILTDCIDTIEKSKMSDAAVPLANLRQAIAAIERIKDFHNAKAEAEQNPRVKIKERSRERHDGIDQIINGLKELSEVDKANTTNRFILNVINKQAGFTLDTKQMVDRVITALEKYVAESKPLFFNSTTLAKEKRMVAKKLIKDLNATKLENDVEAFKDVLIGASKNSKNGKTLVKIIDDAIQLLPPTPPGYSKPVAKKA